MLGRNLGKFRQSLLAWLVLICMALTGCSWTEIGWDDPLGPQPGTGKSAETDQVSVSAVLRINEVMSHAEQIPSDGSFAGLADLPDPCTDWIELINCGQEAIQIEGYTLSDQAKNPKKLVLPDYLLEPREILLILADGTAGAADIDDDGTDRAESTDGEDENQPALEQSVQGIRIHAPFRISRDGEDLILSNARGDVVQMLAVPAMAADLSYGLRLVGQNQVIQTPTGESSMDDYVWFAAPTPGQANTGACFPTQDEAMPSLMTGLVINEYCRNNSLLVDPSGQCPDWVELYNDGSQSLDLAGCYFSDDPDNPDKWAFPSLILEPGRYLLLWLNGLEQPAIIQADGVQPIQVNVPFSLGDQDRALIISDRLLRVMERLDLVAVPENVSYGRVAETSGLSAFAFFPEPTPGSANTTRAFATLSSLDQVPLRQICINEVQIGQSEDQAETIENTVQTSDWIELYNPTAQPVDLSELRLSDVKPDSRHTLDGAPLNTTSLLSTDTSNPVLSLEGITLQPDTYLVVYPQAFALSSGGETLFLYREDGSILQSFITGWMPAGYSSGWAEPSSGQSERQRLFFTQPTPGQANGTSGYAGFSESPEITITRADGSVSAALYADGPVTVSLRHPNPSAVIYYTLDGQDPDGQAQRYSEPFQIDTHTVIRAVAVEPDCWGSKAVMRTVSMDNPPDLPVICIATNPAGLYSDQGLLVDITGDHEVGAQLTWYESDGQKGIAFSGGIALHGQYSRTEPQKSLEINLRSQYGQSFITYPFFPDQDVTTFKRLILRTSGQDWQFTKLRDAFMTAVVQGQTELDTMAVRYCVVYVNGAYFGLYCLRENSDQFYMASHHGTDPDQVDIIKGNHIILEGDSMAYDALLDYVESHDLSDETAYQYVLSQIDELSLMDFLIVQSFYSNPDSGNKKFWRPKTADGQWRWVLFDLDWALFPTTWTSNILKNDLLDPEGHGQQNIFNSSLQCKLMANDQFRQAFITRYAWYLNNVFLTDRMLTIYNELVGQIQSEMPRQIARWGKPASLSVWEANVAELREIISQKREHGKQILRQTFGLDDGTMQQLFPEDQT